MKPISRRTVMAIAAAAYAVAPTTMGARAADDGFFAVRTTLEKVCTIETGPGDLEFTTLTSGTKVTGEFTYSCNFVNGPASISISSVNGALAPDGVALANGAGPVPYGICLRGSASGIRCDNISSYANITQSPTTYSRGGMFLDANNPGDEVTATFGAELKADVPNIAGSYADVVTFQLNP